MTEAPAAEDTWAVKCILCRNIIEGTATVTVKAVGIKNLIKASKRREDDIVAEVLSNRKTILVHDVCSKTYSSKQSLKYNKPFTPQVSSEVCSTSNDCKENIIEDAKLVEDPIATEDTWAVNCILCKKPMGRTDTVTVKIRGVKSLRKASKLRGDDDVEKFLRNKLTIIVHSSCSKTYGSKQTLKCHTKKEPFTISTRRTNRDVVLASDKIPKTLNAKGSLKNEAVPLQLKPIAIDDAVKEIDSGTNNSDRNLKCQDEKKVEPNTATDSTNEDFDFKSNCFYCGKLLKPYRKSEMSYVTKVASREILLKRYADLNSAEAKLFINRISLVPCLVEAEAVYHKKCQQHPPFEPKGSMIFDESPAKKAKVD